MKKRSSAWIGLVMAMVAGTTLAQDGAWQWQLTPYGWAMGMDGDLGIGPVSVSVDQSFSDILENLDIAVMAAAEAHNGTWGVLVDGLYAELSSDAGTALGKVEAEVEQFTLRGAWVYRMAAHDQTVVDVGGGARWMGLDTTLKTPVANADVSESWADPILLGRIRHSFSDTFFGLVTGDIGGFSISSDLTWQLTVAAGYTINDSVSLLLGYRYLDYDYEDDGFVYDIGSSGLGLGVQIKL